MDKDFEIIYECLDTPEAEQRLNKAFDILFLEEDLYEK